MAGAGYKLFNTGDVLTAAQVNTYLMEQTVMVFADAAARTTALSGIVSEGMISYLKDTNAVEVYNGSAWVASDDPNAIQNTIVDAKGDLITATAADTPARLAVGVDGNALIVDSSESTGLRWTRPFASLTNPVINGGMDIWQRGTNSGAISSIKQYVADRWYAYLGNSPYTFSRQLTNDITNLPNIQYCLRAQKTAGSALNTNQNLYQSFETVNSIPFAGRTVTLSFYARKGADYSASGSILTGRLTSGTGTDQPVESYTGGATVATIDAVLTTTWQRFAVVGTVPTTATELAVGFGFTPTGTAGSNDYFEVTGVQIDTGTYTATSAATFRRAGGTIQGELAAAMRYYQRLNSVTAYGGISGIARVTSQSAGGVAAWFPAVVPMRVTPTALDSGGAWQLYGSGAHGLTSISLNADNPATLSFVATSSGATINQVYAVIANNNSASYLGWSAEL